MNNRNLELWHKVVFEKKYELLQELLDKNVEFHSPTVWQPKQGKDITAYILKTVIEIFKDFQYQREWINKNNVALEFSATVDGKNVKGVDLISWNDEGKIVHFEVMLRPINTLQLVFEKMSLRLQGAHEIIKD